jgi:hypothetical protein
MSRKSTFDRLDRDAGRKTTMHQYGGADRDANPLRRSVPRKDRGIARSVQLAGAAGGNRAGDVP